MLRKRGRPKGSKDTKPRKAGRPKTLLEVFAEVTTRREARYQGGRKKGSKNKRPRQKGERSIRMVELRVGDPRLTLQQIGDTVGVSKERARQVLKRAGVPTVAERVHIQWQCTQCGQSYRRCTGWWSYQFCSPECRCEGALVLCTCFQCGVSFKARKRSRMALSGRNPEANVYCGRQCFGRHMGLRLQSWRRRNARAS